MKLKRLLAGMLSAVLSLTSPISSFAYTPAGSAAGANASGNVTGAGGDFSANITHTSTSGKIGIRLTLVNRNDPSEILSVDDKGNPRVVDILYIDNADVWNHQMYENYHSNLEDQYTYLNPKTQSLKSRVETDKAGWDWQIFFYDEVNTWFTDGDMPPWLYHNGSYVSNGSEFVAWCRNNNFGVDSVNSMGTVFTVSANGYGYEVQLANDSSVTTPNDTGWGYAQFGSITIESAYQTLESLAKGNSIAGLIKGGVWAAWGTYKTLITQKVLNGSITQEAADQKIEDGKNLLLSYQYDVENDAPAFTRQDAKHILTEGSTANPSNDELGNGSSSSDSEEENAYQAHIFQILNHTDENGTPIFQTPSMIKGEADGLIDATLHGDDWVLLVEPIIWLTIFPEGIDSPVVHTKMYGTISNFVDAFMTDPILAKYRTNKFFNWKALNQPVWWALTVEGGYAFDTVREDGSINSNAIAYRMPTDSGSYRTFQQLNEKSNTKAATDITVYDANGNEYTKSYQAVEGWGINIYSAGDFGETLLQYTNLPSDDATQAKIADPIKVVKWYVANNYDENGQVTSQTVLDVTVDNFDRTKQIAIMNETLEWDEDAIFDVQAWRTGTTTSVPNEGDTSSTYETYANKSPGTLGGVDPAIVDLTSKPEEKTIYIKLVYEEVSEPGDITVIKVKEPSSGDPIIEQDTASGDSYDPTEWVAESFAVCSTSFAVRKKTVLSVIKLVMKGNAFITILFNHGVLVA